MISTERRRELNLIQRVMTYTIEDQVYNRIAHPDGEVECPGCGARGHQLHVPGCEHELCPACRGYAAFCNCSYAITGDD